MGLLEDRRRALAEGLLGTDQPPLPQMEAQSLGPIDKALLLMFGGYAPMASMNVAQQVGMLPGMDLVDYAGNLYDQYQNPGGSILNPIGTAASLLPFVGGIGAVKKTLPGLLGQFPSTTPGRILNETKKGGYSVNLPTGRHSAEGLLPEGGLMMGIYRNTDPRNMVMENPRRADIEAFAKTNAEQLAKEDRYFGTWRDPDTGTTYFDVSRRFDPEEIRKATKFGERTGQLAGWNAGVGASFPVGNWEDFVRSQEFQNRLSELAPEGRAILSQHNNPEWWDMHNTILEQAYGPQNLPYVAGFTASTAPNSQLIQNVQAMSEYMRRKIKGEPIIQPEWRVPDDGSAVFWQPGRQMPMEAARVNNLSKASHGLLSELQQDKVREEALAMMGDPNAVVLDRYWARVGEDPARGIFTATQEGVVEPGKQYLTMKDAVAEAAARAGRPPRDFSADVWTAIKERIKTTGELFGRKFPKGSGAGESKGYADVFNDLVNEKSSRLGITRDELLAKLKAGDANLLSLMLTSPLIYSLYSEVTSGQQQDRVQ